MCYPFLPDDLERGVCKIPRLPASILRNHARPTNHLLQDEET